MTNDEIDAIVSVVTKELDALRQNRGFGDQEEHDLLASAFHSFEEMVGDE